MPKLNVDLSNPSIDKVRLYVLDPIQGVNHVFALVLSLSKLLLLVISQQLRSVKLQNGMFELLILRLFPLVTCVVQLSLVVFQILVNVLLLILSFVFLNMVNVLLDEVHILHELSTVLVLRHLLVQSLLVPVSLQLNNLP